MSFAIKLVAGLRLLLHGRYIFFSCDAISKLYKPDLELLTKRKYLNAVKQLIRGGMLLANALRLKNDTSRKYLKKDKTYCSLAKPPSGVI